MEALRATIREFWQAREPRERLILGAGGSVGLILLVYLLVWDPIASERARLLKELPQLRTQAADFRKAADEAEALRNRMRARAGNGQPLPAAVQMSAQNANLGTPLASVQSLGADRAQVSSTALQFEPFVRWLATLAQANGITVESVQASALPEPGRVQVESLVLKR